MGPVAIYLNSYEAIVVGRLLSGIARGVGFTAVPLLIAETAPRKSLGRYVSISGWVVMLGYAVGNSLGHRSLLGNVKFWPFLLCVPGLFSLIYLFCSMWFPQTPAWLLSNAKNNNNNKIAFLLLRKLRNGTDIEIQNELDEIIEEINIDRNLRKTGVKELLCRPKYRFQLVLTILLVCSLQTTGVSAVAMYSDDLFHAAGVHGDYATYASIGKLIELLFLILLLFIKYIFCVCRYVRCNSNYVFSNQPSLEKGQPKILAYWRTGAQRSFINSFNAVRMVTTLKSYFTILQCCCDGAIHYGCRGWARLIFHSPTL